MTVSVYLSSIEHKQHTMNDAMWKKATRIKELTELTRQAEYFERYKPISDEMNKIQVEGQARGLLARA